MDFELNKHHTDISDEKLIKDLKDVAKKLDQNKVTIEEYNEHGKYHNTTLTRRFGSWFDCLDLADLQRTRSRLNIPKDELLENILEVWVTLGEQPSYNDMSKSISEFSPKTYENRFGSWLESLETFIKYVNDQDYEIEDKIDNEDDTNDVRSTSRNINLKLRFQILKRDDFKCNVCGKSPANDPSIELHVDHIKPWSKGGETTKENLQALCSDCNLGKSDSF